MLIYPYASYRIVGRDPATARTPEQDQELYGELEGADVGELPECQDHHPSDFEQGKPRSIILPIVC